MGVRLAILVSGHGRGSNMQALIDGCRTGVIPAEVGLVIGVREDTPALERARSQDVPVCVVSPKGLCEAEYGDALLATLRQARIDIVCLAGYMRLLPNAVIDAYRGKVLNIHPALLPLFGGKGMYGEHVHRAVLASGMKVSGCTVHLVDEEYDHGAILVQRCVPVQPDDTPESLAARVLEQEHIAYVEAVAQIARSLATD